MLSGGRNTLSGTNTEFSTGGVMNARIARGFLWGVVATVAMTLVHIGIWAVEGRLTIDAMATRMMPSIIIAKMFGPGLPTATHLMLAALIHLGYGAFWGAMLFALTKRVTFWKGVAMGAFLYLGAHIFLAPLLGRGAPVRGSLLGTLASWFSWFSIATHFTFGATLGLLGSWQDRTAETARAEMGKPKVQGDSSMPAASR
jgi:hypothetical protein